MRHRFRLEQYLKYRESIEDQCRLVLAEIREKQYGEEEKMSRLRDSQRECQRVLQGDEGMKSVYLLCLNAMSQEAFSRKGILRELACQEAEAQEVLLDASRSRKIVEKLRDRELDRRRKSMLKAERKYLDEIAAGRFIRMNSNNI